jgi:hypothetical protein
MKRFSKTKIQRAPEIGLALILTATLASTAAALSSVRAPAPAASPLNQPMDLRGAAGSQQLRAQATTSAARSGRPLSVGMMTYTTNDGLVCFAAGPTRGGEVGRMGPRGFRALEADEGSGSCGDIQQNLKDFGGIALAHTSGSETDGKLPQGIVYGIVADPSTVIRVTWADGTTEEATPTLTGSPEELQGGTGAFALAAPLGQETSGARVDFVHPNQTVIHSFTF